MCKRPYSIIKTLKIDMFSVVYLALHEGHTVIIRDLNLVEWREALKTRTFP